MKEVILSADDDSVVYLVPDVVADNLEKYCLEFCANWLHNSPDAENTGYLAVFAIQKQTL